MLSFLVGDLEKKYDIKKILSLQVTNLARLNPEKVAEAYCCCETLSICTSLEKIYL